MEAIRFCGLGKIQAILTLGIIFIRKDMKLSNFMLHETFYFCSVLSEVYS